MDNNKNDRFLSEIECAQLTGYARSTLQNFRHQHKGFPYYKTGKKVSYKMSEVMSYMERHRVEPMPVNLNNSL